MQTTIRHSDGKKPGIRCQDNRKLSVQLQRVILTLAQEKEFTINSLVRGVVKDVRYFP